MTGDASGLCDLIVTEKEMAEYLGKAPSTVRARAHTGMLPPFYKPGLHKLFLRPVADAWIRSDYNHNTSKIRIDLSPYPALLTAKDLANVLRVSTNRIYFLSTKQPSQLPPRRGTECAAQDLVMWLAKGAGVADLVEVVTRPIEVSPRLLAANASLVALTQQLQQSPALKSSGRGR
ncbi:MAG TPA: hypothetical protein DCK83_00910 [Gallionellaceae bacterium]|nr:hypothetical protein [Gallionellaceae bacterium]